jgi:RNA polymerase sigma factor (sigma-70 family)
VSVGEGFDSTLAAARTGAEWAWTALYRSLAPAVLGYLRAHGAADPEDLLQETFVAAVRAVHSFEGNEDNFRSWIFVIAHRRLLDERRHHTRHPVYPTPSEKLEREGGDVEDEALAWVETERVRALLAELPDAQREVVVLRVTANMSMEEIAQVIGRSRGAVKQLQRRGLATLARLIAAEERAAT